MQSERTFRSVLYLFLHFGRTKYFTFNEFPVFRCVAYVIMAIVRAKHVQLTQPRSLLEKQAKVFAPAVLRRQKSFSQLS
jgi:hypothetical protein